jgi:hypothetical protein
MSTRNVFVETKYCVQINDAKVKVFMDYWNKCYNRRLKYWSTNRETPSEHVYFHGRQIVYCYRR